MPPYELNLINIEKTYPLTASSPSNILFEIDLLLEIKSDFIINLSIKQKKV
jgi:hypothetical protein